jgi:aminopeptidase N
MISSPPWKTPAQYTYDAASRTFTLTLSQVTPPTPGQPEKKPLHIPVSVGLLGQNGAPLSFTLRSNDAVTLDADGTAVLNLREASQTFVLENVAEPAVPSLLRGFSAPVRLKAPYELADLRFLMQHDRDSFNRWEASQKLATALILNLADAHRAGSPLQLDVADVAAYGAVLNDTGADPALIAEALTLPSENDLALERTPIDVEALHVAREYMRGELARALRQDWRAAYDRHLRRGDYRYHVDDVASRRLKNLALSYLMADPQDEDIALAVEQFNSANNMTDEFAALRALVHSGRDEGKAVLARFYDRWRHEDLVIDKWFTVQATAPHAGTIEVVRQLRRHPDFHLRNPNRARSLIGAFAQMNPIAFHDLSGQGYDILCDAVMEMERFNPAVAARLLQPLGRWQRHDPRRQGLMKERLEKILKVPDLAKDVYEIAAKSLNAS